MRVSGRVSPEMRQPPALQIGWLVESPKRCSGSCALLWPVDLPPQVWLPQGSASRPPERSNSSWIYELNIGSPRAQSLLRQRKVQESDSVWRKWTNRLHLDWLFTQRLSHPKRMFPITDRYVAVQQLLAWGRFFLFFIWGPLCLYTLSNVLKFLYAQSWLKFLGF